VGADVGEKPHRESRPLLVAGLAIKLERRLRSVLRPIKIALFHLDQGEPAEGSRPPLLRARGL
jgi:hypothetical protein